METRFLYVPPKTIEEAEERWRALQSKILRIEEQQSNSKAASAVMPDRRDAGRRGKAMGAALQHAHHEKKLLEAFITVYRQLPEPIRSPMALHNLLRSSCNALNAIQNRGVPLSVKEKNVLIRLAEVCEAKPLVAADALTLARNCCQGSNEQVAETGIEILLATHDPADLAVLERNWERSLANLTPSGRVDAGRALVQGYLVFARVNDATRIAAQLPPTNGKMAVEAWLEIAKVADVPAVVMDRARAAASTFAHAGQKARGLVAVFRASRLDSDLNRVQDVLAKIDSDDDAGLSDKIRSDLAQAHTEHGTWDEARGTLMMIGNPDRASSGYGQLAVRTRDTRDLAQAVRFFKMIMRPTALTIAHVIRACAAAGQSATARELVFGTEGTDDSARCLGFATLSAELGKPDGLDDLEQALHYSALSRKCLHVSEAFRALVEAMLVCGYVEGIVETAQSISKPEFRCSALMRIHKARLERTLP